MAAKAITGNAAILDTPRPGGKSSARNAADIEYSARHRPLLDAGRPYRWVERGCPSTWHSRCSDTRSGPRRRRTPATVRLHRSGLTSCPW